MAEQVFHLFFGSDEPACTARARESVAAFLPEAVRVCGLETVDGAVESEEDVAKCLSACGGGVLTLSLLGDRKAVWLRNAAFLAKPGSAAVRARIADFAKMLAEGLPAGHLLVVTAPGLAKDSPFLAVAKKLGRAEELNLPQAGDRALPAHVRDLVRSLLKERGLRMEDEAVQLLAGNAVPDARFLAMEIEKFAAWAGYARPINAADVRELGAGSRELRGWDLQDAVGNRDLPAALKIVRRLLLQGEEEIGLLMMIHGRLRELILFRDALDAGWITLRRGEHDRPGQAAIGSLPPEADALWDAAFQKSPRQLHPFRLTILTGQAANFRAAELRRAMEGVAATYETMVTSPASAAVLLETLLHRVLRRPVRRPAAA
jgi:DNA polymerase-3 subunit delta